MGSKVFSAYYRKAGMRLGILAAILARAVAAQPVTDQRELIERLQKQIERLEARVQLLEKGEVKPPPVPDPAPEPPPEPPPHAAVLATPRMELRGYAGISFDWTGGRGGVRSFAPGEVNLLMTSRLTDSISVLAELAVERGEGTDFAVDLERLQVNYTPKDYFNLALGRFNSNLGYYNPTYGNGHLYEIAATKPLIVAFRGEEELIPHHGVGLSFTGRIPSGPLGLGYILELTNGRERVAGGLAVETYGDEEAASTLNIGLVTRPPRWHGFQAGFNYYRDNIYVRDGRPLTESIFMIHAVYDGPRFQFLNEGMLIRHRTPGQRLAQTPGFYTQIAARVGNIWPYFRYQYVMAPHHDPVFTHVGHNCGAVFGVRYDIGNFAALKMQYEREIGRGVPGSNKLAAQMAFTF